MMKIAISIDDVHPQTGWRILGDQTEVWLRELNERFGAKYTLFVPSNYHKQYPLSKHKSWVNELSNVGFIELAAHGHYHMTSDPQRFGECEMLELDTLQKCDAQHYKMIEEWGVCGVEILGWKNPGWLCHPMWNDFFNTNINTCDVYDNSFFEYVSVHYEHNHGMKWNCTTFFGHDDIQETDIKVHNISEKNPEGMIMFTSHIAGDWNKNVWNQDNFEQLRSSLEYLTTNFDCEFKTLKECL